MLNDVSAKSDGTNEDSRVYERVDVGFMLGKFISLDGEDIIMIE